MKKFHSLLLLPCLILLLNGCATPWPESFSYTMKPGWVSIEIREGVSYERAWNTVFQFLSRDFDMAAVLREEGYLQTAWLNTWSGTYQDNYKVRVTIRFSSDRRSIQLRTEAWTFIEGKWYIGTDSRLMSTLKTDLMGTVGRTTR
ncbi:MAG: hypothetical protein A2283_13655 [Lentisphaerae bacterium RIFOXYA12_FULL_48_11]|nr:MAG: hypothetical protein A2283_13655 [Lentisphaerae bacterium RIFOXYA12_FULL_48_11]